ncbi:MAG TPA: HEAT repeat domain-containing protein [Bryobacteraceae bacterium]|nr:HEAT repeat domain-containing protein [Bryobacteraceae bacterium]
MKFLILFPAVLILAQAQNQPDAKQRDTKERARAARDLAKEGENGAAKLMPYVTDADLSVRLEAVKALDEIGGPKTIDPLLRAAMDNDPEIQIRATDGLVNSYLPGYIKSGISGTIQRAGNAVRAKFSDTNDQIIDAFVEVRPDVIAALGRLATGGASLESRANACRALGILRGRGAIDSLTEALHSKDDQVMYEALIALQKIRDAAAGPRMTFLLRDLNPKIQITAIETAGLLRTREAAPDIRDPFEHSRDPKIRRTAISSLAMIADPSDHTLFLQNLSNSDDTFRAAAAEGLGRLKNPADAPAVEKAFMNERKMNARLSMAFAVASLGNKDMGEFGALRYLTNTLNSKSYKGVAVALLTELARDQNVRQAVYPVLAGATKDEKIQLGVVLANSGDQDSVPYLQKLQMDPDPEVAQESIRSLRVLRARLP